mmetsp:Transcript_14557/g.29672  ORF Transcript_14557/g.29672 Transcript_14557/m.29672 type:complete len:148 (+) Transcript_14557:433-876(+)
MHRDRIPLIQMMSNILNRPPGNPTDVQERIDARPDVHEGSVGNDLVHLPLQRFSRFHRAEVPPLVSWIPQTQSHFALGGIDGDDASVSHRVSFSEDVVDVLDAIVGDLGDVEEGRAGAGAAGGVPDVDEDAEVADVDDFSGDFGAQF